MTPNPEQLEKLITERQDGHLTAAELAEVERAVAADIAAAKLARHYEKIARLLTGFRTLPAGVDLDDFRRTVSRQVSDEAGYSTAMEPASAPDLAATGGSQFAETDELVGQSFRSLPPVDWSAFRERVSAAVKAEAAVHARGRETAVAGSARPVRRLRWLARAAVPLAAAAVLLIAIRQGGIDLPSTEQEPALMPTVVSIALDRPRPTGQVLITFDRSAAPAPNDTGNDRGGIIIATAGAVAPPTEAIEMALLF